MAGRFKTSYGGRNVLKRPEASRGGDVANDRLRSAISGAGLTIEQLSEQITVDPKTIDRWITGGRTPHATNRQRVAAALQRDEAYLWPNAFPDNLVQSASESEILSIYPSRAMIPASQWDQLLAGAHECIDVLAFSASFLHDGLPTFHEDLLARAAAGVRIRILLGDPDSAAVAIRGEEEGIGASLAERCRLSWKYFRPLLDTPGVEARRHGTTLYASMFRFDDDLLINQHLYGSAASHSTVLHVRRLPAGRLFSNALSSLERVWCGAQPVTEGDLA